MRTNLKLLEIKGAATTINAATRALISLQMDSEV